MKKPSNPTAVVLSSLMTLTCVLFAVAAFLADRTVVAVGWSFAAGCWGTTSAVHVWIYRTRRREARDRGQS